ncbi:Glutathione S-transferase C-terminal-like protein [Mycena chlorophos]|uniref:Glutathione S-transferase C-terminal-like protein n=1 Tax=Mycena chlorophos TaxID=658473 RepID=A0A8H6S1M5_MYCCL|nr:Glutathione S-transferase C-terminal-like protein [Mycena chlorophos]
MLKTAAARTRLAGITSTLSNRSTSRNMASSAPAIKLYGAGTPNGRKVLAALEELKQVYGTQYEYQKIDLSDAKLEQKEPWFIKLNPNGRIPVIEDREAGFPVFETGAILAYLQQKYDVQNKFGFVGEREKSEVLQWMFWANAGLGPMMGQAGHFIRASEQLPYAQNRYIDESKRLLGVMEIRLKENNGWLVGDHYSIADLNAYCWVVAHSFIRIPSLDEWPAVKSWFEAIAGRDAVKAAYAL